MVQSHDSLEPGRKPWAWLSLNLGSALILAVVLALLTFFLTSSGEATVHAGGQEITTTTEAVATTAAPAATMASQTTAAVSAAGDDAMNAAPPTTIAVADIAEAGGDDTAGSLPSAVLSVAGGITNMGPTEVGFVSNFPAVGYTWDRVELETDGQTELNWLGELGGRLVAVGSRWSDDWSSQSIVTYLSDDGADWEAGDGATLPEGSYVSRVVDDGERIYAFAEGWEEQTGTAEYHLYTTSDGATWSEGAIDLDGDDADYVYLQNAAAGPAGLAVAAAFDTYPEQEPVLLDFGEVQVNLDYEHESYQLIDATTGDELMGGSLGDILNWGDEEGQRVFDPATGEVIVTVPYEVWEAAYNTYYEGYGGGTPLPLPIYNDEPAPGPVTVEYGEYIVEIDENQGSYRVLDAATNNELATGSLDYLYQGPPPRFVDPETGAVLLEVTWDEWYAAEENGWRYVDEVGGEYTSRTELLTSVDGETWASTTIPGRYGSSVTALVPTADGFLALVNSYGDYGDQSSVWTFADGEWSSLDREQTDLWFNRVVTTGEGFAAVGDGSGGQALWSSADGIDWVSEFAIVTQSDGSYVYLPDVAADDSGMVAVLAHREKWSDYKPLVMEKDGYTLTFEDGETALTVTDGADDVVLSLGWDVFDEGTDLVIWEDGVTYINLDNGDVVAITDEEAYQAMEARWSEQGEVGISVFLGKSGAWAEAIVDVAGGLSGASQIYLLDGKIVIAGSVFTDEFAEYNSEPAADSNAIVILVGSPSV